MILVSWLVLYFDVIWLILVVIIYIDDAYMIIYGLIRHTLMNKGGTTIYDYSSLTGKNPVRDFFDFAA